MINEADKTRHFRNLISTAQLVKLIVMHGYEGNYTERAIYKLFEKYGIKPKTNRGGKPYFNRRNAVDCIERHIFELRGIADELEQNNVVVNNVTDDEQVGYERDDMSVASRELLANDGVFGADENELYQTEGRKRIRISEDKLRLFDIIENVSKGHLTVLWLDDQRDPYKYLNTNKKSDTFLRNKQFYDKIMLQHNVNFVWVKNLYQFIDYIKENGLPQFVSFDHALNNRGGGDGLSDEQKLSNNGVNCAKWLVNYCKENGKPLPKFYVHSANPKHGPEINKVMNSGLNENKTTKKIISLTESDIHYIVKNSICKILNGIGNTPKGQFMLGRLKYKNGDRQYYYDNVITPEEIDDYAENARLNQDGYDENLMNDAYNNAERYEDYQNDLSTYNGDDFEKMCKDVYPIEKYIEDVNAACGTDDFRFNEKVDEYYEETMNEFIYDADEESFYDEYSGINREKLQRELKDFFEADIYSKY